MQKSTTLSIREVSAAEKEYLLKKRSFDPETAGDGPDDLEKTKFGLALSGGGVRSATVNTGFLETLNKCRVLEKADYLSTVSGGGYTGSYVQGTLKHAKSFRALFTPEHIDHLRRVASRYMAPNGFTGVLTLVWSYLTGLLFSQINPAILVATVYLIWDLFSDLFLVDRAAFAPVFDKGNRLFLAGLGLLFGLHFLYNIWKKPAFRQQPSIQAWGCIRAQASVSWSPSSMRVWAPGFPIRFATTGKCGGPSIFCAIFCRKTKIRIRRWSAFLMGGTSKIWRPSNCCAGTAG